MVADTPRERPTVLVRIRAVLGPDSSANRTWCRKGGSRTKPASGGDVLPERSIASRTHCVTSAASRRNSSRSCDFGPWPVTTRAQLVPVRLGVAPAPRRLVEAQLRVGQVRPISQMRGT